MVQDQSVSSRIVSWTLPPPNDIKLRKSTTTAFGESGLPVAVAGQRIFAATAFHAGVQD